MNKRTLFLDFDGVIANSILAIVKLYNEDFSEYDGFRKVDWSEIKTWNFNELTLADRKYIDCYFNQPRFFQTVEFMPFAKLALEKISQYYDITIVSNGNTPNLRLKEQWCHDNMLYAEFIGIDLGKFPNKSHINMNYVDSVFIDDLSENLRRSNAVTKICFGDIYTWNEDWDGIRCESWHEVLKYLLEGYEDEVED